MSEQKSPSRALILSELPFATLRAERNKAAAAGDRGLADDLHAALSIRSGSQNSEIENSGELFEHEVARWQNPFTGQWHRSVRYTGDSGAFLAEVCAGQVIGATGNFDRTAGAAPQEIMVHRDKGERAMALTMEEQEFIRQLRAKPGAAG